MAVKNPTTWRPGSGSGYIVVVGMLDLVDNAGNFLVDNSQNNLVTTPIYLVPKYTTPWVETGV